MQFLLFFIINAYSNRVICLCLSEMKRISNDSIRLFKRRVNIANWESTSNQTAEKILSELMCFVTICIDKIRVDLYYTYLCKVISVFCRYNQVAEVMHTHDYNLKT